MISSTYTSQLSSAIQNNEQIILRTTPKTYEDDVFEALSSITNMNRFIIMLTYDEETSKFILRLQTSKIDTKNMKIIDCIGEDNQDDKPQLKEVIEVNPTDYNTIETNVGLFSKKYGEENCVVVFVSLHNLADYDNINEIGMFLYSLSQMLRNKVPIVIIEHLKLDLTFVQILNRTVDEIIQMKEVNLVRA
jgi:predicted acyl esterase